MRRTNHHHPIGRPCIPKISIFLRTIVHTTGMKKMKTLWKMMRWKITRSWKAIHHSNFSLLVELPELVSDLPFPSNLAHLNFSSLVSRTCTAPFDRLKVFLITRPPELNGAPLPATAAKPPAGFKVLASAVTRIYAEGGLLAFWTGNGLSVAKIFPESAIKFFAYESSVSARFIQSLACPQLATETSLRQILGSCRRYQRY